MKPRNRDRLAALVRHWLGIPSAAALAAQQLDMRLRLARLSAIEHLRGREIEILLGEDCGTTPEQQARALDTIRADLRAAQRAYGRDGGRA